MSFPVRFFVITFACCSPLFLGGVASGSEVLRYAGTTTLQREFMSEAAHLFGAAHNVRFHLEGGNSRTELRALRDGVIDLADSGHFLSQKEKATGLVEHLLGWDLLVVVVHATNPMENVNIEDLRRMLSGEVLNWNEIGGRDLPVLQVAAPLGSGIHEAVAELSRDDRRFSPQVTVSLVVADADRNVAFLPAAFTVTSLSMVDVDQVKIIKVNGFYPNRHRINAGNYPLRKPLFLVTKGKPRGTLALFVNFAKSTEGQAIIARNFLPLNYP